MHVVGLYSATKCACLWQFLRGGVGLETYR
jgi:hypothetical protein